MAYRWHVKFEGNGMTILRHILQSALLAAVLLPLTACATEPQVKPGRVLEADCFTNQPQPYRG